MNRWFAEQMSFSWNMVLATAAQSYVERRLSDGISPQTIGRDEAGMWDAFQRLLALNDRAYADVRSMMDPSASREEARTRSPSDDGLWRRCAAGASTDTRVQCVIACITMVTTAATYPCDGRSHTHRCEAHDDLLVVAVVLEVHCGRLETAALPRTRHKRESVSRRTAGHFELRP